MIDRLAHIYSDKIFQHIIIVFTGLDKLDVDFQTFISEQCSSSLKNFLERCGHRYIGINNNDNKNDKDRFVSNLIDIIMKMLSTTHTGRELLDN